MKKLLLLIVVVIAGAGLWLATREAPMKTLEGLALPKMDIKGLVNGLIGEIRDFHQPKKAALQAQKKAMQAKAADALRLEGSSDRARDGAGQRRERSRAGHHRLEMAQLTTVRGSLYQHLLHVVKGDHRKGRGRWSGVVFRALALALGGASGGLL